MQKNVLITGASGSVGCALVQSLMQSKKEGETLTVYAQGFGDMSRLQTLADGTDCIRIFEVDLTDDNARQGWVIQLAQIPFTHFVHIPALRVINCRYAGMDTERLEKDLSVQLRTAIQVTQTILPPMAKRKYGRVLFMLTDYLLGAPPAHTAAYIVSKSALQGLMKSLAVEYAPKGITVNAVAPGMIQTDFLQDTPELIVQQVAEQNPMKRIASVEDIIPAMRFLLGEDAGYITGVTLPINGGGRIQ